MNSVMVYAEMANDAEFVVPAHLFNSDNCDSYDEELIRDWIFENCQEQIRRSISIKPCREQLTLTKASHRLRLLDKISQVQRQYLLKEEAKIVFGGLLDCLLEMMDSEYGFIGAVKYDEDDGSMFLQTTAVTNIAWNDFTRKFYEDNIENGLQFRNMNTLFGKVLKSGKTLIANDSQSHPDSGGIPDGHPPLTHFLGIPFFVEGGTVLSGMVGIANKPGGYTQEDVDFLEPLVVTCSNLIQAYNTNRENEYLINKLEDLVVLRTNELELANQKIVEAARMQIEHFACMSHEIRTPLNCVIGLSSLLQETELNPFQADSMQMIVKSGELLMAVVNDVLDYSKLQTDNMNMEINETSLQDTIDAVVHSIESKASEKNLEFKTSYDSLVPETVMTDSRRLQQILYNLLGNAIKFSKNNGEVKLSVSVVSGGTTKKETEAPNSFLNRDAAVTWGNSSKSSLSDDGDFREDRQNVQGDAFCRGWKLKSQESRSSIAETEPSTVESAWNASPTSSKKCVDIHQGPPPSRCPFDRKSSIVSQLMEEGEEMPVENTSIDDSFKREVPSRCPFARHHSTLAETIDESVCSSDEPPSHCPFSRTRSTGSGISNEEELFPDPLSRYVPSPCHLVVAEEIQAEETIKYDDVNRKHGDCTIHHGSSHSTTDSVNCAEEVESKYWLRFVVTDYGKGIPKKDFNNIFQPFHQVNSETNTFHEGTGLGLAITTRLVKGLGGKISVDSELGKWTEFALELPLLGEPVKLDLTARRVGNIRLCLVSQAVEESMQKIARDYGMNIVQYDNCDALSALADSINQQNTNKEIINVCVIQEDLYKPEAYRQLASITRTVLMTYGPKYSVQEANHHFRSLFRTLPSTIMKSVLSCVENIKPFSLLSSEEGTTIRKRGDEIVDQKTNLADMVVLIAEDNLINQKVLSRMLQRLGLKNVDIVENGREAVEQSAIKEYDIILMDMQMPVMGGLEATRIIVDRPTHNNVKPRVVFVTAHASQEYENMAKSVGGSGFISKPFNLGTMQKFFNSLLPTALPSPTNKKLKPTSEAAMHCKEDSDVDMDSVGGE